MRLVAVLMAGGFLAGCTAGGGTFVAYGPVGAPDGRASFCENYANQTASNAYENYYDPEGVGSLQTYRQAQRIGDAAYERCLSGRTN